MRPCEVLGSQDAFIGPASRVARLQLVPPFVDDVNPTLSWQVEAVQVAVG